MAEVTETTGVPLFAKRRPNWQLPELAANLQLAAFDALEQAASRQPCQKCQRSRFLFCYDCCEAFTPVPSMQLPFQLSIITHHAEQASKNTGVHAKLLCPGQVQLHSIEDMPASEPSTTVVMFPSDDALLPEQLDMQQVQRVVIIDSKWAKAKELNSHKALLGMKRVKLPGNPKSAFWRFHTQGVSDDGVCTIESLHLLLQALADAGQLPDPPYHPHCFDNLLWYFAFQHQLVAKKAAERHEKWQKEQVQGVLIPEKKKKRKQRQEQQQQQQHPQQQQQQGEQWQVQQQQDGHGQGCEVQQQPKRSKAAAGGVDQGQEQQQQAKEQEQQKHQHQQHL